MFFTWCIQFWSIKVQILWEGQSIWKNLPPFLESPSNVKTKRHILSNLWLAKFRISELYCQRIFLYASHITKNSTSLSTFCMEFFYCVEQKDKNMFARSMVFLRGQLGTYIVVHTGPPEHMVTWGTVPHHFLAGWLTLFQSEGQIMPTILACSSHQYFWHSDGPNISEGRVPSLRWSCQITKEFSSKKTTIYFIHTPKTLKNYPVVSRTIYNFKHK